MKPGNPGAAHARLAVLALLTSDIDARPPRLLTPAFYGCYDWHSAVHGHWLLARAARMFPDATFAALARAALAQSLTPGNIAAEVAYLRANDRTSFERPYGLSWLLQLAAELRSWKDPDAQSWAATLQPLEAQAAARIKEWLPKLHYPIRVGEHSQTAFAFGLIWDWAKLTGDREILVLLTEKARSYYAGDRNCEMRPWVVRCRPEADIYGAIFQ